MNPTKQQEMCCLRCGKPMVRIRAERWHPGNLLLRQLQKLADGAGIEIYHCVSGCGKIEFFKQPGNENSSANTGKRSGNHEILQGQSDK